MTAIETYAAAREKVRTADEKLWKAVEVSKKAHAEFRLAKEGLRAEEQAMREENVDLLAS